MAKYKARRKVIRLRSPGRTGPTSPLEKLEPWADLKEEDRKKLAELTADLKEKQSEKLAELLQYAKKGHILAGPYTSETRPNRKLYNVQDRSDNHLVTSFANQNLADILDVKEFWIKLGGTVKRPGPQQTKTTPETQAVKDAIGAKLDPLVPIQYVITSTTNFKQVLDARLGSMVYDRLLEVRDIFKTKKKTPEGIEVDVDIWTFEFTKEDQLQHTEETVKKIVAVYSTALNWLIAGKGAAKEHKFQIDLLNDGINQREASLILLRTKIKEDEWNLGYWQRYGRLATSMMSPDQLTDFYSRMEYITQLEASARGMEQINAQIAAETASLKEAKKKEAEKETKEPTTNE